ncbi:hypothetical protein [Kribbella kalugense]|uniref:hypothetical protein n=1 Tax=Kribbella kalugense TaxID=2512221 RepID=UPI0010666DF1|nr:hypothetical protein [Kribbella kalugense]
MTTLPQEYVKVLAQRLADYSGGDLAAVRAAVQYAGDDLPSRITELMLNDMRDHVEDQGNPAYLNEYQSVRRRLLDAMRVQVARVRREPVGTAVLQQQGAREDAEQTFAEALRVADPVAVGIEVPRALELQHSARIAAGLDPLAALPAGQSPSAETVGRWLTESERLSAPGHDDADRQRFVTEVDRVLRRAAGDAQYEPRSNTRESEPTLRDGVAVAWARGARLELGRVFEEAGALGEERVLGDPALAVPERFEGRMVDGLAAAIGERTGRSAQEVLDVMCAAGGPDARDHDQWHAARQFLAPEASLARVQHVDPPYARWLVVDAMREELKRHYGTPDREPSISPEEVGARMAAEGAQTAENLGVGPASAIEHDADLDAAMKAAGLPPSSGQRPSAREDLHGQRPGGSAGRGAARGNQIGGGLG